ncbi:hypothetical protein V2J09_020413 [Rumex salicifolius]
MNYISWEIFMEWNVNNPFRNLKDLEPKSMMDMAIIAEPVDIALGSSEKGNVIQPGKPRKKTMTSMFLRYFDTAADGKSRSCKLCGQTYSISTATAYHECNCKIPLDTSTRWSGYYQMLDLVRKANKSMDAVIRKHEGTLENRMLLSSTEKNAISIIHGYLEPFYKTTNNICTDKAATVGLVLFFMEHISEMISACRESRHWPDWLKCTAEEMAKKSRSYNSQVCNIFTYMTAILDPRIKGELIPDTLNSEAHLEEARSHFIRNYSTHFPLMAAAYGSHNENGGGVSFAEEIARKKRRSSISNVTDELSQYLSEPPAPIPTDVLEWWKMNMARYPRLSMMARDFLAVQANSSPPDELFCSKGDEIEKQRFCMSRDNTRLLMCVKSWCNGGFRLRCKATEIDYDRIMELAENGNVSLVGNNTLK